MQLPQEVEDIGVDITGDKYWFYEGENKTYFKITN